MEFIQAILDLHPDFNFSHYQKVSNFWCYAKKINNFVKLGQEADLVPVEVTLSKII